MKSSRVGTEVIEGGANQPLQVLIAGGGVAGIEAALALNRTAAGLVEVEMLAPADEFVYRPLAVAEPFGLGSPRSFPLDAVLAGGIARHRRRSLAAVEPARHVAILDDGTEVPFGALLLAVGVQPKPSLEGALTYRGPLDNQALAELISRAEEGEVRRIAFAVPTGVRWALPLYELALLTADHFAGRSRDGVGITVVTPERQPLEMFGRRASESVRALVEGAGIELLTASAPAAVEGSELVLASGRSIPADRVVAMPKLEAPPLPGIPQGPGGFIGTDRFMRVEGVSRVYAAGDSSWFPIKQGGLAAQQADVAASSIAALAGADVERMPFKPVLRGALVTGGVPRYLRSAVGERDHASAAGAAPLWWPPSKIAGRFLAPHLASLAENQPRPPLEDLEPLHGEKLAESEADQRDALELALAMADADARWGDHASALRWLEIAEQTSLTLSPEYAAKRRDWVKASRRGEA